MKIRWYLLANTLKSTYENHCKWIVSMVKRAKSSGLYDKVDKIVVFFTSDFNPDVIDVVTELGDKMLLKGLKNSLFEDVVATIIEDSNSENFYALFLHTNCFLWTNLYWKDFMEYLVWELVERWENCVLALETHNTCGVNLKPKMYENNCWWARSSYLKQLPNFETVTEPAHWLLHGAKQDDTYALATTNVNHYESAYPRSAYVPRTIERNIPWPLAWTPIYIISIHECRLKRILENMGDWNKYVIPVQGTNGNTIDKGAMIDEGTLQNENLTRGEIGCYDSHRRVWEMAIAKDHKQCVVMEDDADIASTSDLGALLREIAESLNDLSYDMVYLGHGRGWIDGYVTKNIAKPIGCYGLVAYLITRNGAQILYDNSLPICQAVDMFPDRLDTAGKLKRLTIFPSPFFALPGTSDTRNI